MKLFRIQRKLELNQTDAEEVCNFYSHALAGIASFVGLLVIVYINLFYFNFQSLISILVYGISLIFLFTASSVYHFVKNRILKEKLRVADHAGIFIMIAGTYTPILVLKVQNSEGWILLIIQWSMALIGIILKIFFTGRFEVVSLFIYLLMGWLGLLIIDDLYTLMSSVEFCLMILGGVAYTLGVVFYLYDHKIKFGHFIWHLFVIKGCVLHFVMVAFVLF